MCENVEEKRIPQTDHIGFLFSYVKALPHFSSKSLLLKIWTESTVKQLTGGEKRHCGAVVEPCCAGGCCV
jgi:hypothetical protein